MLLHHDYTYILITVSLHMCSISKSVTHGFICFIKCKFVHHKSSEIRHSGKFEIKEGKSIIRNYSTQNLGSQ